MKKSILALLAILVSVHLLAEDKVLMTIDGTPIYKSEFEYIYNKNNAENSIDHKTLDEYIELYINFKLKVTEAQRQGLDTSKQFIRELAGYRTQLATPYLTDSKVEDALYREAYSHFSQDCEVSHILFTIGKDATPADTLAAYSKALEAVKRLQTEDFAKVAVDMSDDRSVDINRGYLGFFTAMQVVWPFEKAMYDLPIGKISDPIRTDYGYHVIKVHSRRHAAGQIHAYHIMKMCTDRMPVERQQSIYNQMVDIKAKLDAGASFDSIARVESEDNASARRGGDLNWFGIGRMVPEFENAAFALKTGQISEPVKSQFGWHIIKVVDRRGVEPFEKKKSDIQKVMKYDARSLAAQEAFADGLRGMYNYSVDDSLFAVCNAMMSSTDNDSIMLVKAKEYKGALASFANQHISVAEFVEYYLALHNRKHFSADKVLRRLSMERLISYEDKLLEKKYPDFANLIREYHDGILLFDISNREVWDKALSDTAGLIAFFNEHRKDYKWQQPRFKGFLVQCANAEIAKTVKKQIADMPSDSVLTFIRTTYNRDSIMVLVERGLWKKSDNPMIDKYAFGNKKANVVYNERLPEVFVVGKKLTKYPEEYKDVRGSVTADYQNQLEKEWVARLRNKYLVEVVQEVVDSMR